jgi:hypothetical protein
MAEFLHPSVSSRIIDNSNVFITAQGLTVLFAAFTADQGPDNKIQLITSKSEFMYYYGAPNMKRFGQTAYNICNWLDSGGSALCLRVLPYIEADSLGNPLQQSTYACYILEVGTKLSTDVPPKKLIKHRTRVLGDGRGTVAASIEKNLRTQYYLKQFLLSTPSSPEPDGFTYYPLMVIHSRDRGAYFNKFGVALELNDQLDETYTHRLYNLNFYSNNYTQDESFVVSFYPEASTISSNSQFVVDVLYQYSNIARAVFNDDNYDAVCNFINSDPIVAKKIDIIELRERNVRVPEVLHSDAEISTGSADLSPSPEIYRPMGGGSDGDWVGPNSLESLLYKAYSGSGDFINVTTGDNTYDTYFSEIWDKKAYPIDILLDANYPTSVKIAISNFSKARGDIFSILDVGFTGSPGQAIRYRQDQLSLNTYFSAIFVQDFIVQDNYQGTEIQVTPTYFLAEKIPFNDISHGIHWPFVGPRRGSIVGFKSISWVPNPAYREELYKIKLNYVEKDVRLTRFNTQLTAQFSNSALSDISHVRTLLRIRRELENMAENYQFEFNDPATWDSLQYSVNSYLQTWVANRALESASGMVYASAYDRQQRILRVKTEVVFTGLIERIMIDLIVNR